MLLTVCTNSGSSNTKHVRYLLVNCPVVEMVLTKWQPYCQNQFKKTKKVQFWNGKKTRWPPSYALVGFHVFKIWMFCIWAPTNLLPSNLLRLLWDKTGRWVILCGWVLSVQVPLALIPVLHLLPVFPKLKEFEEHLLIKLNKKIPKFCNKKITF